MRKLTATLTAALCLGWAGPAGAAQLATKDQGMAWRAKLQALIADNGIEAAIQALRDRDSRWVKANPAIAIHLVEGDTVYAEAHTLFPTLKHVEMTKQRDLKKRLFIQNFLKQVRRGGGAAPTTHVIPQTGKSHQAACYNEWAKGYKGQYFITVCYDRPGAS